MAAPNPEANATTAVMVTSTFFGTRRAVPLDEPVSLWSQEKRARSTCTFTVLSAEPRPN